MATSAAKFERTTLSASDFDNTIAQTFDPAPNGLTVEGAYEMAVERIFGRVALDKYRLANGLRNRAPAEVVQELRPDLSAADSWVRTEDLVEVKLEVLHSQVGKRLPDGEIWPRPAPGFKRFWNHMSELTLFNTGVVSSGHDTFIHRFFDVHDLPQPDVLVSDDDMRPLMKYIPKELCVKPGRLLMDIVHTRWLAGHDVSPTFESLVSSRSRIVYCGDDPHKDGQLARDAGVTFVHIDPYNAENDWRNVQETLHAIQLIPRVHSG